MTQPTATGAGASLWALFEGRLMHELAKLSVEQVQRISEILVERKGTPVPPIFF